jgi:hypothetical protein
MNKLGKILMTHRISLKHAVLTAVLIIFVASLIISNQERPTVQAALQIIMLYPSSGPPGTDVLVKGFLWTNGTPVIIFFNNQEITKTEPYGKSNEISVNFTIPESTPYGKYTVTAKNIHGSCNYSFTVAPSTIPTPSFINETRVEPTNQPSQSNPFNTPTLTPAPTVNSTPTATPAVIQAVNEYGSTVDIGIMGNVTATQITGSSITTNQTSATITVSFKITGQSGTTGFGNITIPKSSVQSGLTPILYIDNQVAQDQGYTQDADNYYVWYTAHFSTHQISITFSASAPTKLLPNSELISTLIIVTISVVTASVLAAGVLFYRKSQKPHTKAV